MALVNGRPHALMLPMAAQGHIQAMLQLAKVLHARGFYITFVNTEYTQQRLLTARSVHALNSLPNFRFETIPEHGRTSNLTELCRSLIDNGPLYFDKLIDKMKHLETEGAVPPLTCIISDGVLLFRRKPPGNWEFPEWPSGRTALVASPLISSCLFLSTKVIFLSKVYSLLSITVFALHRFRVLTLSGLRRAYLLCILLLAAADERCFTNGYMDQIIPCILGMPQLRVKDLPKSLQVTDSSNYIFQFLRREAQAALEADFVILNTFDELDGPIIDAVRESLPALYTIGPLVLQAQSGDDDRISDISASMWTEEIDGMKWLNSQEPCSVIYVCFGSITVMSNEELLEFAWGLEASRQPFLWAIRPDLLHGQSAVLPREFLEKVEGRSFFVRWAPQMKVLSHPSVGGFLTHSGWNSTVESICAGVPMISWPSFAEQITNRRFVTEVWKIGLTINEIVKREHVGDVVERLMRGEEGRQMRKRIGEFREASMRAVGKGGSSYNNLEKFVQEIQRRGLAVS